MGSHTTYHCNGCGREQYSCEMPEEPNETCALYISEGGLAGGKYEPAEVVDYLAPGSRYIHFCTQCGKSLLTGLLRQLGPTFVLGSLLEVHPDALHPKSEAPEETEEMEVLFYSLRKDSLSMLYDTAQEEGSRLLGQTLLSADMVWETSERVHWFWTAPTLLETHQALEACTKAMPFYAAEAVIHHWVRQRSPIHEDLPKEAFANPLQQAFWTATGKDFAALCTGRDTSKTG